MRGLMQVTPAFTKAAAPKMLDALESFPAPVEYPTPEDFVKATNEWWDKLALPAINEAKGLRP